MKYKVLIKKCTDPGRVDKIADEIARWSGTTADAVRSVITQKSVCIRKEADENEALRLKQQFEAKLKKAVNKQLGTKADTDLGISVETLPQFQEEWRRAAAQMDEQYIKLLEEFKRELRKVK